MNRPAHAPLKVLPFQHMIEGMGKQGKIEGVEVSRPTNIV